MALRGFPLEGASPPSQWILGRRTVVYYWKGSHAEAEGPNRAGAAAPLAGGEGVVTTTRRRLPRPKGLTGRAVGVDSGSLPSS